MSGSGAFGLGLSRSSSRNRGSSESGVSGVDRAIATQGAFDTLNTLGPIISSFMSNVPTLSLQNGLTPGARGLAGSLVNDSAANLFSKLSGTGALRGQLSPNNTSGIIGSATSQAVSSALPQFIQQAQQNELFNTTSAQNTQSQGIQFLQGLASLFTGLTEGSSASQSGRSSGRSINLSGSGGGGAGGGAFAG